MSVTVTSVFLAAFVLKVTAVSTLGAGTVLYWYVDGRLFAADTVTERIFTLVPGQTINIQVLDTTASPDEVFPGQVAIHWYAVDNAVRYQVQEYTGGEWVNRRVVVSDGAEVFSHELPPQTDGTAIQWRVLPVNEENIAGDAFEVAMTVVCAPAPVAVVATYDAGTQRVTVTG